MPSKKHVNQNSKALAPGNAAIDGDILGPFMPSLPLIEGENEADYQALSERCLKGIKPKDAVEVVWAQDFIDYAWEAKRLRRMKMAHIKANRREAVQTLLCEYMDKGDEITGGAGDQAKLLAHGWSRDDEDAVATVEAILSEHGLDHDAITAQAITANLATYERLDKLIASYDYRRDAAHRELEKRRDLLAKRARDFGEPMITDVEPQEPQELDEGISAIPASL